MGLLERLFKLKERETTVRREFSAGMVTFFAMCYILSVNAGMFANPFGTGENPLGVSFGAMYIATALSAFVGCMLMGLLANLPIALASAMGENAFFVYTVCLGFGLTFPNALALTFVAGVFFVLLTATGLRRRLFRAIPRSVRVGIAAGLGLFIALLGLKNAGVVVVSQSTGLTLGSFNLTSQSWGVVMPPIVALATFWTICDLSYRKFRGAPLIGIIAGTALYYLLGLTIPGFYENLKIGTTGPLASIGAFGHEALGAVFTKGFDFSEYIAAHGVNNFILVFMTTVLAMCMMDLFDTVGTLYATCRLGSLLTKDGDVPNMDRAMMADSPATAVGSVLGVSTVSAYLESGAGVTEGGKTGLASVFTGLFFLAAIFLAPFVQLIPSCAVSACLVYVGVPMLASIKDLDLGDMEVAVPAFMTLAIIPLSCNIAFGIAFGMLSHVVMSLASGKGRELAPETWIVAALFCVTLLLTH